MLKPKERSLAELKWRCQLLDDRDVLDPNPEMRILVVAWLDRRHIAR